MAFYVCSYSANNLHTHSVGYSPPCNHLLPSPPPLLNDPITRIHDLWPYDMDPFRLSGVMWLGGEGDTSDMSSNNQKFKGCDLFRHGDDPAYTEFGNVDEVGDAGAVAWRIVIRADVQWSVVRPHQFVDVTGLLSSQCNCLWWGVVYLHCHHLFLHLT